MQLTGYGEDFPKLPSLKLTGEHRGGRILPDSSSHSGPFWLTSSIPHSRQRPPLIDLDSFHFAFNLVIFHQCGSSAGKSAPFARKSASLSFMKYHLQPPRHFNFYRSWPSPGLLVHNIRISKFSGSCGVSFRSVNPFLSIHTSAIEPAPSRGSHLTSRSPFNSNTFFRLNQSRIANSVLCRD